MRRKPACRTPRRPPKLDPELANLAAVIAEYQLDNNAYGWFRMPWRDGWNAVRLAHAVGQEQPNSGPLGLSFTRHDCANDPSLYWAAEERLIDRTLILNAPQRAALRCLQVLIANSSGGGEAYNAILIPAFLHVPEAVAAPFILEARCRDSIGTTAQLQGDANDRQRAAFRTAWSRGLYMAAYSIPPAIKPRQVTTKP